MSAPTPSSPASAPSPSPAAAPEPRQRPSSCLLVPVMLFCVLYLLNFTGWLPIPFFTDLVPDTYPVIGNLDEATVTLVLVRCLAYYGLNLDWLLGPRRPTPPGEKKA